MSENSDFAKQFENLGFHIMDIKLKAINNKGELAGYFEFGKYNEKKKSFVRAGYKTFFWDGNPHILPLNSDSDYPEVVKLNYNGVVLVRDNTWNRLNNQNIQTTYLWDIENGIRIIDDFYGYNLNDSSTVLGFQKKYTYCRDYVEIPAIWKDGYCITLSELLGVSDIHEIAPHTPILTKSKESMKLLISTIKGRSYAMEQSGESPIHAFWNPAIKK
jgi:hypothetical protein